MNAASEYGLSFDAWGRLWLRVTPSSAKRAATGLEVIEVPWSAWMVNTWAVMPWAAMVSAMNALASSAVSVWATIQPTT
jgi:hypothetical protein